MHILNTAVADASNGFVCPQVQHMGDGYRWEDADSVTQMGTDAAAGATPNMRSFHLDPMTRFTDIVSQGYVPTPGLLVSSRLDRLLASFERQGKRRWPADVVLGQEHRDYAWLDFDAPADDRIDWPASTFELKRDGGGRQVVRFGSAREQADEVRRLVDTLSGELTPHRIAFVAGTTPWDLFEIPFTTPAVLASDRLAVRLLEAHMTGFHLVRCAD